MLCSDTDHSPDVLNGLILLYYVYGLSELDRALDLRWLDPAGPEEIPFWSGSAPPIELCEGERMISVGIASKCLVGSQCSLLCAYESEPGQTPSSIELFNRDAGKGEIGEIAGCQITTTGHHISWLPHWEGCRICPV